MLKKSLVYCFIFITILSVGCVKEKTDEEIYNDIQETIVNMKSYSCVADITVTGNMAPQSYKMSHMFKAPDRCLIRVIEPNYIEGKTTIYNGKKTMVKQPKINQSWELNSFSNTPEANAFLGSFIYGLSNRESLVLERESVMEEECLVINTVLNGDNYYFKSAKLWMNLKKHHPVKLQIFDKENVLRVDIKYSDFKFNVDLEDGLFEL